MHKYLQASKPTINNVQSKQNQIQASLKLVQEQAAKGQINVSMNKAMSVSINENGRLKNDHQNKIIPLK